MLQHHRNLTPNLGSDIRPLRALTKPEGLLCALFERCSEQSHGIDVCVEHDVVFFSCEVSKLETVFYACCPVVCCCCFEETKPVIHKLFCVFTSCAKIHELDLRRHVLDVCWRAPEDYASRAQTCFVFGFQRKLLQLGSVCIALNSNNSFKHSSTIPADI